MNKQKPAERKVIFRLEVFELPASSAAIQVQQVKDALRLAISEIGGPNGRTLSDQLLGPFDQFTMQRPVWGTYDFAPTKPPA
ncbi:MAG: hypothetical protein WAK55_00850 [Xanthobacteraceae bacterium]